MKSIPIRLCSLVVLIAASIAGAQEMLTIGAPSCASTPSLCKTDKERQESLANIKKREAEAAEAQKQAAAEKSRRNAAIEAEVNRLGEARRKEAEKYVAMREAAERARPKPDIPAPECKEEIRKFSSQATGKTKDAAYAKADKSSNVKACGPQSGQKQITCSSEERAIWKDPKDKCLKSAAVLCEKEVVWTCFAEVSCNEKEKKCGSDDPSKATAQ